MTGKQSSNYKTLSHLREHGEVWRYHGEWQYKDSNSSQMSNKHNHVAGNVSAYNIRLHYYSNFHGFLAAHSNDGESDIDV